MTQTEPARGGPPRRIAAAILNALMAGVVPRVGLEHIVVGRQTEVTALLRDLDTVADGGASFRLIVGRYGSGKSFLLHLLRAQALASGFAVCDADLSPERRLTGGGGAGLGTYRELTRNFSTRARPDGAALGSVFERWLADLQAGVAAESGLRPTDPGFVGAVEARVLSVVTGMQDLVHGFDFAAVLMAYWRGHALADEGLKDAALRWLRGEYALKSEARAALGVRVIIDDDTWYDYLKLLAYFTHAVGFKGLIVMLDEAVNLYKISHAGAREANFEKLLTILNDTLSGRAAHLGLVLGGTPQFLDDQRRGLASYEALRSRLSSSRFAREGLEDTSGPVLRLAPLEPEELFVLLERIAAVHAAQTANPARLSAEDLTAFMQEEANRLGARALQTPREVTRDFVSVLNLLAANPGETLHSILGVLPPAEPDAEAGDAGGFADFTL